jgi:hypothetical protein
MRASPNSALLVFPLGQRAGEFQSFLKWWLNYLNHIIDLSDQLSDAKLSFPETVWGVVGDQRNLFFGTPLLSKLNQAKIRRLYFLGADLSGDMETNIRVSDFLGLDPVLVWSTDYFGEIGVDDLSRIQRYCEIIDVSKFVEDFDRGRVDFQASPRGLP